MFRYLAIAWNSADPGQMDFAGQLTTRISQCHPKWDRPLDVAGLRVWATGAKQGVGEVNRLSQNRGVIVGTIFRRNRDVRDDSAASIAVFDETESASIIKSGGRQLIQDFWGSYVAFLNDDARSTHWVLRAPMSDLPCFQTESHGVTVFFSWFEDCLALNRLAFTIDWTFVKLQAAFGHSARLGESGVLEVSALVRGECWRMQPHHKSSEAYWNPCSVVRSNRIEDPDIAAQVLRATTRSTVLGWGSLYPSVLVRLSGGLDSSLLFCTLAKAPSGPKVTGLNYYWPGARADERVYARAVAEFAEAQVIEREFGLDVGLNIIKTVAATPAPVQDIADWQEHRRDVALANQHNASAIMMGALGDVLFQKTAFLMPATDYIQLHGFTRKAISVLLDVAHHQRMFVGSVFVDCLRNTVGKPLLNTVSRAPRKTHWNVYELLLHEKRISIEGFLTTGEITREVLGNLDELVHPWLRDVAGVPLAKLWMIASLNNETYYDSHYQLPEDPPTIPPYITQPLAEVCLQISSYINVGDGWDRAIMRRAFSRDLPSTVLKRSTKGTPAPWINAAIDRNREFVAEFLLDGLLVRNHIFDPRKIEMALPGVAAQSRAHAGTLMNAMYSEAWLQALLAKGVRMSH